AISCASAGWNCAELTARLARSGCGLTSGPVRSLRQLRREIATKGSRRRPLRSRCGADLSHEVAGGELSADASLASEALPANLLLLVAALGQVTRFTAQ